jgi:hypothetical protein
VRLADLRAMNLEAMSLVARSAKAMTVIALLAGQMHRLIRRARAAATWDRQLADLDAGKPRADQGRAAAGTCAGLMVAAGVVFLVVRVLVQASASRAAAVQRQSPSSFSDWNASSTRCCAS